MSNQELDVKSIELNDDVYNQILEDKEKHVDYLSLPGNYQKALCHFKATQFYNKAYFEQQTQILFCDDCLNPIPEESITKKPDKYPFCTSTKNVAELGTGVYLYFYFIKFIFFMCVLIFGVVAMAQILVINHYNSQVGNYCYSNLILTNNTIEVCDDFRKSNSTSNLLYSMSFDNLLNYKKLVNQNDAFIDNDTSLNVNLINFVCMCVMLVINWVFIVLMSNLETEVDVEIITPEDFTLMISDIPDKFRSFDDLRLHYLQVDDIIPIEINPTFKLSKYMALKDDFVNLKKKLRYLHAHNLTSYKAGCCSKIETKEEIARNIINVDIELNQWIERLNNLDGKNNDLFSGTVFATFDNAQDYEDYLSKFPKGFFSRQIRKFNYYFCKCLYKERTRAWMKQSIDMTVEVAPEPNDTKWANLEITNSERFKRSLYINLIVFLLLCLSFGTLLLISWGQKNLDIKDSKVQNIVSVLFACVTSMFNFIITKIMISLTLYERNVSQTRYLLSLSIKLLIFTFLNSGVLPVVVSYTIPQNNKNILINNVFYIFILNSVTSPITYFVNPFNILRYFKRKAIRKNVEKDPNYHIDKTQGELNLIFEFTDIELAFKYSYIGKTMAIVVWYLPILPLGAPISFLGFILLYIVEKINVLYFYKRPEKIDGQITIAYIKLFRWIIFVYAISLYIFIGDIYKKETRFELIAIILFGALSAFPISSLFRSISILNLSEVNTDKYLDLYFEMGMTYDMANPITKSKGFEKYLDRLKEKNIIDNNEYKEALSKITTDPSDIIELYYQKKIQKNKKQATKTKTGIFKKLVKRSEFAETKSKNTFLDKIKTKKENGFNNLIGIKQHDAEENKEIIHKDEKNVTHDDKSPIKNYINTLNKSLHYDDEVKINDVVVEIPINPDYSNFNKKSFIENNHNLNSNFDQNNNQPANENDSNKKPYYD